MKPYRSTHNATILGPAGIIAALLAACTPAWAQGASPEQAPMPPPATAPTPFTAEQIRDACPPGRRWTFRISAPDGTTRLEETVFTAADGTGGAFRIQELDPQGRPTGEPRTGRSSWEGLRKHGAFPAAQTEIASEEVTTTLGRYRMKVYRVRPADSDGPVRVYYFAEDLPGPPLRVTVVENGKASTTMEMVHRE